MTASDPFVSGTLDDISTTETGNWPKPAVTMDMVMDKARDKYIKSRTRTFAMAEEGRYVQVECSVCDSVGMLSVPVPPTNYERDCKLKRVAVIGTDDQLMVHRVRAQLPGWTIPMIALDAIECSACTEPPY